MNTPKAIDIVVKNDLCIGCGLCVYACPTKALEMQWNSYGFLIPNLSGTCDSNGDCIKVCPFNPLPEEEVRTENELAKLFLMDVPKNHSKIGIYSAIYAGYAKDFRLTSSSGGMATYIFSELMLNGVIDHVFSVKESQKAGSHYEYDISSSKEELLQASKTRYFPVTLGDVMSKIRSLDGKVAIVGVACFIKAIRLAQHKEPALKEKIPFLVGIICGGVKSRFFTEYLAGRAGVTYQNVVKPEFRIKDLKSTAGDYSFGCINKEEMREYNIKMRSVGDMWGTGLFKANSCDFCDDVTTELADISLGDAWLPPFNSDGKGNNVVVTRSRIADNLIQSGIERGDLIIEELSLESFLASQQGSFNHRQNALGFRISKARERIQIIPIKRHCNEKISLDFKLVQLVRLKLRKHSLEYWKKSRSIVHFDKLIRKDLIILSYLTKFYHLRKRVINKSKKILGGTK